MNLLRTIYALMASEQARSVVIQISYSQPYKACVLAQKRGTGEYLVIIDEIPIDTAQDLVLSLFTSSVVVNKQPMPTKKQLFSYGVPYIGYVLPADITGVGADIMLASNWSGPRKAGFVLTRQINNTDKDLWAASTVKWRKAVEDDPVLKSFFEK